MSENRAAEMTVLMFHGVGVPGHALEDGEADYWVSEARFAEMANHVAANHARRVELTFDDGNASDLAAARVLHGLGLSAAFFVLVGRIGKPGYLSVADIGELRSLGMEVGLHGRDHVDLRRADDATMRSEIDLAREELADICHAPVTSMAIPYGLYDRRVWNYLARTDFRRIHTSDRGTAKPGDRFVRRNPIMAWHGADHIAELMRRRPPLAARARMAVMPRLKRLI
ncbi:polysaccharide deacetylase family protein [Leptolyngbya sp. 15MV]|nr:polysaccharide deacetylase family protein [Leptolyngbya sp. 15MV]